MEDRFGVVGDLSSSNVPFMAQPIGKTQTNNEFDLDEVLDESFGSIDFAMIINLLFSLVAIFLAFDLVSRERELGTLKLLHVNYVSRSTVISGKWLAGMSLHLESPDYPAYVTPINFLCCRGIDLDQLLIKLVSPYYGGLFLNIIPEFRVG